MNSKYDNILSPEDFVRKALMIANGKPVGDVVNRVAEYSDILTKRNLDEFISLTRYKSEPLIELIAEKDMTINKKIIVRGEKYYKDSVTDKPYCLPDAGRKRYRNCNINYLIEFLKSKLEE